MFSPERVVKILELSAQFYHTNSEEKQKELVDQVLALTNLQKFHEQHGQHHVNNFPPPPTHEMDIKHGSTHPPMASLIKEAITKLHERGGSSLQAIKKFIFQSYHLNERKVAPFIRKYLREAVAKGILLHPKGRGATGHFKIRKREEAKGPRAGTKKDKKPHPKSTASNKRTGLRRRKGNKKSRVKAI